MDSSFASPVGKEIAAISAKQRFTGDQYVTDSRPIPQRQSTDTLATVDRNISAEVSAECRPTYRPIVSTDGLLTKTTCWPTLDQHSTDTRPTYRPSVGRYIGRVSVTISADNIDRHSVDRCLKYTWSAFHCVILSFVISNSIQCFVECSNSQQPNV